MFDNLSERLERSFKILKGEGKITEINVAETLKDVRKALLDADVNYKVAKSFTDTVKEKALGQNVLTAVKPSQLMVKIVHDELTQLLSGNIFSGFPQKTQRLGSLIFQHIVSSHSSCRFLT